MDESLFSNLSLDRVLAKLDATPAGLTSRDADSRYLTYGPNDRDNAKWKEKTAEGYHCQRVWRPWSRLRLCTHQCHARNQRPAPHPPTENLCPLELGRLLISATYTKEEP